MTGNPFPTHPYHNPGSTGFALQPGDLSSMPFSFANIVNNCINDANASGRIFTPIGKNTTASPGTYKVALVIAPGIDYHWYRQNPDGMWSHKPGATQVINIDKSGDKINDPEVADRGIYTFFVGFFEVGP